MTVQYIRSPKYDITGNLYSLWEARYAIQEPFLLLECDLIFDSVLLGRMLEPGRIAVSHTLPWMYGTTVSLDHFHRVTRVHVGNDQQPNALTYKTVNIYSLSSQLWQHVILRLEQHVLAGRTNEYYEAVFAEIVADGHLPFQAVFFDNDSWYEIDTLENLYEAERLFSKNNGRRDSLAAGL